jgi:HD-like signal output (HDOD) protein
MANKIRIIFVDDDVNILSGLRRMLRLMRNEWEMTFAHGGQKALDALAENPYDVIVSDMRMPGISGAQLLNKVKEQYPQMVRIALSGQTSKEAILNSVGPIHQYISKPCDADTLKHTISHVCSLQGFLANEKLLGLITQLESLPSISSLYSELMQEVQSDKASIDKVAKIISRDVGMSVKVMQLVNSAFFGVRQNVFKISQAVALLGLETITALVLSAKVFSQFEQHHSENFSINSLWGHSMQVGKRAKLIAQAENAANEIVEYSMVAGMLHDVGKLVLAVNLPDEYEEIISLAAQENTAIHQVERKIIAITHAEVGAYLLGLWGFSNVIIESLAFHHRPQESSAKEFTALTAVHVADVLTNEIESASNKTKDTLTVDTEYLETLGLSEQVPVWRECCREILEVKS